VKCGRGDVEGLACCGGPECGIFYTKGVLEDTVDVLEAAISNDVSSAKEPATALSEIIAKKRSVAQGKLVAKGLGEVDPKGKFVYFQDRKGGKAKARVEYEGNKCPTSYENPYKCPSDIPTVVKGYPHETIHDSEERLGILQAIFQSNTDSEVDLEIKDIRNTFWVVHASIKDPVVLQDKIRSFEDSQVSFKLRTKEEQKRLASQLAPFGLAESASLRKSIQDEAKRAAIIAQESEAYTSGAFDKDIQSAIEEFKSSRDKKCGEKAKSEKVVEALRTRALATSIVERERKNIKKIEEQVRSVEARVTQLQVEVFDKSSPGSIPPNLHRARNALRKSLVHSISCLATSQARLLDNIEQLSKVNVILVSEGCEACVSCGFRRSDAAGETSPFNGQGTERQTGVEMCEEDFDLEGYAEALLQSQEEDAETGCSSTSSSSRPSPGRVGGIKWGTFEHQRVVQEPGESSAAAAAKQLVNLRLLG